MTMSLSPDALGAFAAILNVAVVFWIALITRRYTAATERILIATERTLTHSEKTLQTVRTASYGTTYTWAATLLSAPALVSARRKLFDELKGYKGSYETMPADLREAFEQVCRTYDLVGIAGHNGMLPHRIIAEEWGDSLIRLHEMSKPYLDELRAKRGDKFWNNFSELYKEAKECWPKPGV